MFQRIMHVFLGLVCLVLLGVQTGIQTAQAVTFGQIDVASHMGEPFYAEVPLSLDADESLAQTSVEIGAASDYRILEVYRDGVINAIRVDVLDDERGPRITLSSEAAVDAAFFNLVLKVRYGRSTHYKKMPVFLEIARGGLQAAKDKPKVERIPAITSATVRPNTSQAFIAKAPEDLMNPLADLQEDLEDILVEEEVTKEEKVFGAYDGWARTARYGPMVYGDTITTVAKRLRLNDTFSQQQVMVALFEKNRDKFDNGNINNIKAGTYLDVPSAKEVRQITPAMASQRLAVQNQVWKGLLQQPQYAAVAEAQRTRYTRRVRIGQQATGSAKKPMLAAPAISEKLKKAEPVSTNKKAIKEAESVLKKPVAKPVQAAQNKLPKIAQNEVEKATALEEAKRKITKLTQASITKAKQDASVAVDQATQDFAKKLAEKELVMAAMQKKITALESAAAISQESHTVEGEKLASNAASIPVVNADMAAIQAQNKRLEIKLLRLENERDKAKVAVAQDQGAADWMLYAVAGLGALVLLLMIGIAMLMRREPAHPAEREYKPKVVEKDSDFDDSISLAEDMSTDGFTEIEDVDAETFDTDAQATKVMHADDFEMPNFDGSYEQSGNFDKPLDMLDGLPSSP
ncbi:MAG: FimV/HubP family polar landmark protein, partial [Mariprofundaceae bacterium]|nr:FimV/HubP family polar landmark protein [Mariprofundaceae bacterium]